MTADERLEALLSRAGQTISDLPKRYEQEHRNKAFDAADKFGGSLAMTQNFEDYILHLTDVIDRMETALENVCGERDWPKAMARLDGCWTCMHSESEIECECERPEGCVLDDDGRCVGYEYAGVPEDWRPEE